MTGIRDAALVHRTIPAREGDPPHPVLILLHGRGTNELDLLDIGPALDPRLFVISARAPFAFGPASYYWYDLEASITGRPTRQTIEESLLRLSELRAQALAHYPIDSSRLFMAGFSQGGAMTAAYVLTTPSNLAGAMILSGYVPIQANLTFQPMEARLPVFEGHGTLDPVLPIEYGRASRDYLLDSAVQLTYREYPIAHTISEEELSDASLWMRSQVDSSARPLPTHQ